MPIEAATFISTLDASNPPSTDLLAEGDDHLRLLKSVLKASFPNITGAMTATHTVLNGLDGRVTAVQTQVDLADNGASVVPVSGVLEQARPVNAQTVLNYTYLLTDRGKLVTRANAAAMGDTLPQATGSFGAGWFMFVENVHATSLLTITPTTSTIDGAATLVVRPGSCAMIVSDGTNYQSVVISADPWRYLARTTTYTVTPADCRPPTVINFTTAGVTLNTTVAASNFAGCVFVVQNSAASGDVTFDPNGAELIDGRSTLLIHPGQSHIIACDGTGFRSIANNVLVRSSAIAAKTATYNATTADRGKSIPFSGLSADVTLNLPAAASCGDGFILFVSNEDTSTNPFWAVTVDPNGAELIDGQASRKAFTGSRLMLLCDGTGWRTVCGSWVVITPQQNFAAAANASVAHGQGVAPRRVWGHLVCITADLNYSVGDIVVPLNQDSSTAAANANWAFGANATDLFYTLGGNVTAPAGRIPNKTTGAASSPTLANWKFHIVGEF